MNVTICHVATVMGVDTQWNSAGSHKQVQTSYLENRPVEEESEQLNEVEEDVAVFFLHPYDVGQGKGPIGIDASVRRGGPREKPKLEKVLHHYSQLWEAEERGRDHEPDQVEAADMESYAMLHKHRDS